jgi:hypothetical protein
MKKQLQRIAQLSYLLWFLVLICLMGLHQTIEPIRFWIPIGIGLGLIGLLLTHWLYKTADSIPSELGGETVEADSESIDAEGTTHEEATGATTTQVIDDEKDGVTPNPDAPPLPEATHDSDTPTEEIGEEIAPPMERQVPFVLHQYLTRFVARYGGLYQFLQEIPVQPDEAQKQQVRRWLVEMGLHAHSLARAYKLDPTLNALTEEPNILLILNDQTVKWLPETSYRTFVDDPNVFDRRYQFIHQVLRDMDLGELENALAQKIYITPVDLTPHTHLP